MRQCGPAQTMHACMSVFGYNEHLQTSAIANTPASHQLKPLYWRSQMGWGDPHYNGGTAITPELDQMARQADLVVYSLIIIFMISPSR